MSTAGPGAPTRITIHRTSTEDEQSRQILCSVDGTHIGQLLFGGTLTRPVEPGDHKLTVNNTLVWKTRTFHVEPGGHVHFTVWNRLWGGSLIRLLLVFFGAAPLALGVATGPPADGGPASSDPNPPPPGTSPLDVGGHDASQ